MRRTIQLDVTVHDEDQDICSDGCWFFSPPSTGAAAYCGCFEDHLENCGMNWMRLRRCLAAEVELDPDADRRLIEIIDARIAEVLGSATVR